MTIDAEIPGPVSFTTAIEVWQPTSHLRIVMRKAAEGEAGMFIDGRKPVLQQLWSQLHRHAVEWRDVPVVIEEDGPKGGEG